MQETQGATTLALATALRELVAVYPTDDVAAPVTLVELQHGGAGQRHRVELQPGHVAWLLGLVMDETATCRNAHADGSGECAHCAGTGRAGKESI